MLQGRNYTERGPGAAPVGERAQALTRPADLPDGGANLAPLRLRRYDTDGANDMADQELQVLQGTLDVLVMQALSRGPDHGYAITRWIREVTDEELQVEDRALYLALHRMEERGWVESDWGLTENNRRAKYYALTAVGRRELAREAKRWRRYAAAVGKVLSTQPAR